MRKEPTKSGLEYDVTTKWKFVVARLRNNPSLVRFAKRSIRKRQRAKGKKEANEWS